MTGIPASAPRLVRRCGVALLASIGIHVALVVAAVGVSLRAPPREMTAVAELIAPEGPAAPAPDPVPPRATAAVAPRPPRAEPTEPAPVKPPTPPVPKPVDAPPQPAATVKPEEVRSAVREPVEEPAAAEPAAAAKRAPDSEKASAGSERPTDPAQSPPTTSREAAPDLPSQALPDGGSLREVKSSSGTPTGTQKSAGGSGPAARGDTAGVSSASRGAGDSSQGVGATRAPEGAGVTRSAIPRGGYQVRPPYPASARQQSIQGTALLRVYVAADGRVTSVAVARSAGHADLDQAAADAVRQWRFDPGRRGDEAVGMWVQVPVEFRLR